MPEDSSASGSWDALLSGLAEREEMARAMGGPERLARQRARGRLDARARIAELCDPGSFRELGTLVGGSPGGGGDPVPADALVGGIGSIDGRPVVVGSEDFTVLGGSIGVGTHSKRFRLAQIAGQERVPLVMMLDGAGQRAQSSLEPHPRAPNDLQALAAISGRAPTVAVVMGPSAGHGALTAPLMDHVVMVEGAAIFSAGPPLVEQATGERASPEELGGVDVHVRMSGVAHDAAPDDASALAFVRRYLSYMPSSAWERPACSPPSDATSGRRLDSILDLVPADSRRAYDMVPVLEELVDDGSLTEIQRAYGASMITALGRLGGQPVALLANQPKVMAGAVDAPAAQKGARFLDIADAYHLPVVFLADNPGVLAGTASERAGILRSSARLYAVQARLRVPKLHVTLRKAFGFGSSIMAMNPFDGQTLALALPGAQLGAMPARGAAAASGASEEGRSRLDAAERGGPYRSAHAMGYDEVIDPRDLRNALLAGLRLAGHRLSGPATPREASILP